jgi:ribose transport system permease protein
MSISETRKGVVMDEDTSAVAAQPTSRGFPRSLPVERLRDFGIVFALIAIFIALSVSSNVFLTTTNLLNILEQWAPVGIMALGGTIVLISGGFDLSIGAIFTLSSIVAVIASNATDPVLGVAAGVACGALLGAINGVLGTYCRMNVFTVTLGSSIAIGGLAGAITGGTVQNANDMGFGFAANNYLGINVATWVFGVTAAICALLLARSVLGRYTYAVGGNEEASRLAGVNVNMIRLIALTLSGVGGGIAGVLVASAGASASASANAGIAFNVWTAMLLGGNSMWGGEGSVWRCLVGVALLALISNGFDLLAVDPLYQQVATGVILLAAIGLDALARAKRR